MSAGFAIRPAKRQDVPAIRALLADDALGAAREDLTEEGLERYLAAFDEIDRDERNNMNVAVRDGEIVGVYQVTYIPYLARGGNERALIEAVRVASSARGQGIGRKMMEFALDEARKRGCALAQLTTDKTRKEAHRFYESLGFVASHEGMKLALQE
ncbi:MAG: GNAT family N-acetyltransferase [Hyphomicrobiales bacterium]